jgi:hypothetical protein
VFERFLVGEPGLWLGTLEIGDFVLGAQELTILALAFATPVLLSTVLVEVALRLVGRGPGPADALADVLVPGLRLAFGVWALGAAWSAYESSFVRALTSGVTATL